MPERTVLGEGHPIEEDITRCIGERFEGWNGPEIAMRIGYPAKKVTKWLSAMAKAGYIQKVGKSGAAVRWCSVGNVGTALEFYANIKIEAKRRQAIRRNASKRSKRTPVEKPVKPKPPPLPQAFTIPPRGVPCSVWALASV